jgi:ribosome-binding protein aMBF1 (putative translation factor)
MSVLDTTYHKRRTNERLESPEFRAEYERTRRELAQVNAVMQQLDDLRVGAGLSKADLAREIGRNDAVVRRLFTAQVNPELRTIAALAAALDAEIRIVVRPRPPRRQRARHAEAAGT